MRIDPQKHSWMTAPETRGCDRRSWKRAFCRGAVRNALLGVAVMDIDIAVPMPPEEAQKRLEAANIKVIPTGIDHGTVTAIFNNTVFEITSLRRDIDTDGRHAVVAYTTDWAEDAARRDFTMNALYAAADGEVFDYAGGVEDLIAGRVRFVAMRRRASGKITCASCGCFAFTPGTARARSGPEALHAAANAKAGLAQLSGERVAK